MRILSLFCFLAGLMPAWVSGQRVVELATDSTIFSVSLQGTLSAIRPRGTAVNYVAADQAAPVLALRVDGKFVSPSRADWDDAKSQLRLHYPDLGAVAMVTVNRKPTHLVLELVELQSSKDVELVVWGPYPLTIGETIGEVIGVARNRDFAVGFQSLNAKTLGGFPYNENDSVAGTGGDDRGSYPELPEELRKGQSYRGDAARPMPFGSVLQAYCRNRKQARVIPNWGHEKYRALPFADGGVVGSRIALFGCTASNTLATLGAIEIAEGLPHPLIDGVWGKMSPGATASYLIVDFGELTIDRAIEMTRRAGLRYLYHSSPFATWGHFKLKPDLFPHGWDGFRECVEKARKAGVRLGFHTLSNFITPNDEYVTPRPDPRLAVIGSCDLAQPVDAQTRELVIQDPTYFKKKSALNAVRLGMELIRFGSISASAPWKLLDCQRGAWGTEAVPHPFGTAVDRLLDHDYKVFHGDAELSVEIARRIAELCNRTGALQLSMDGLEGNFASGYGDYGQILFTQAWYDALDSQYRGQVINDASGPAHFNWHINTRMNWGEPWYAGFRESQTLYRFKNQVFFERNLMPHMLGWFALRSETSPEDAEWLAARAAGFDAGFALATSLASTAQLEADAASADTARQFGATLRILEIIRQWETARMQQAFPREVKALLRDNTREFRLQPAGVGKWELREAHLVRGELRGEGAVSTEVEFVHQGADAILQWVIHSTSKDPVDGVRLECDGRVLVDLEGTKLLPGGNVRHEGGHDSVLTDRNWKEVGRAVMREGVARISAGRAKLKLSAVFPKEAQLKLELRTYGAARQVGVSD